MVYFGAKVAHKWRINGVYALEISSNFAAENERYMATVGLIGTGLAYLNLKKAENEYNALVDQQDALIAALETMRAGKNYEEKDWEDPNPIDLMPGVSVTTILRVGNLVGQFFKAKASVVISNTGSRSYYVKSVTATCYVLDLPVAPVDTQSGEAKDQTVIVHKMIRPGEVMEIELPGGTTGLYAEDGTNRISELRELICNAAGKKLITSIWRKFNIEDAEKANVAIWWDSSENGTDPKKHVVMRKPGVLRYCMEAFYPN